VTWRDDKTLIVLSFFTIFFSVVTLVIVFTRPNDGQTFTAFLGLTTGFAGSILKDLPGGKQPPPLPPAGSTTAIVTQTEQVVKVPPEKGQGDA